jgi:hypothetical protein
VRSFVGGAAMAGSVSRQKAIATAARRTVRGFHGRLRDSSV